MKIIVDPVVLLKMNVSLFKTWINRKTLDGLFEAASLDNKVVSIEKGSRKYKNVLCWELGETELHGLKEVVGREFYTFTLIKGELIYFNINRKMCINIGENGKITDFFFYGTDSNGKARVLKKSYMKIKKPIKEIFWK